jgi:enoyl-CoA hydratase/carnithine racemase
MDHGPELIRTRTEGRVLELVLDRPERLNALNTALAQALVDILGPLAGPSGPCPRAVVLSSSRPRAFCAGADLAERADFGRAELHAQRVVFRAAFAAVRAVPVPVISAIEGFALGGGLELALNGDLIVAATDAVLGLPEVRVGIIPGGGGTQLLPRRVGLGVARDLILTGRRIDGAEGYRIGLVDRLVEPGQARAAALALAASVVEHSPIGVRAAKQALNLGWGRDLAAGMELEDAGWQRTANSPDWAAGLAGFNSRCPPEWPE